MKIPTKKSIREECSSRHSSGHYFTFKDCRLCKYYQYTPQASRFDRSSCWWVSRDNPSWKHYPLEFLWKIKNFKQKYLQYLIERGGENEVNKRI